MDSNESGWLDQAESILDQLLKFTAQLAELEKDPDIDAKSLSMACARRLEDLKRLIPGDLKTVAPAENDLLEKMRELYSRTQVCLEILQRKSNKVASEIQGLSQKKRALDAYGRR